MAKQSSSSSRSRGRGSSTTQAVTTLGGQMTTTRSSSSSSSPSPSPSSSAASSLLLKADALASIKVKPKLPMCRVPSAEYRVPLTLHFYLKAPLDANSKQQITNGKAANGKRQQKVNNRKKERNEQICLLQELIIQLIRLLLDDVQTMGSPLREVARKKTTTTAATNVFLVAFFSV